MAKNLQAVARRALTPCATADAFRFADGTFARDLADLRHAVSTKSLHLIAFHKADYHVWVQGVLGDPALARRVERLSQRDRVLGEDYRAQLALILNERIVKLRDRVI